MAIKILFFDYRETEKEFFRNNNLQNYDIKFFDFSLNEDTIDNISEEDLSETMIISVFISSILTKNVIERFRNLRVISTRATGYDNINQRSCIERNIALINVQRYGEVVVAEFTFAIILALVRKLPQILWSIKNNDYKNKSFVGRNLQNLSIGVVGTGSIGGAVCKLANAFQMKIFAYDIVEKNELIDKYNVQYTPFDFLIKNSDIVTLHLPYTGDNYHMFSENEFNLMKQNSYFINVSRGELVELKYLKDNLDKGKIIGAGLDVVACESLDNCENMSKKMEVSSLSCLENSLVVKELMKNPNVIITPHIAYESQDAINYILQESFDSISSYIKGGNKNRVI